MALNLEKVNINKATQYLDIITKKKTRALSHDQTLQRIDEIEDEIVQKTDEIAKLGSSLIVYPIKLGDQFTSVLYNAIIDGIDDDIRNTATGITKITTILNKVIDTINRYHNSMMDRFNESVTEIRNISKLSESTFEFNDFVSDSYTTKTNDYQFRDAAENTEDSGLYKMATFTDDSLVDEHGDAYSNIQILNDNITVLYESGSLYEENIDEAYNIIGFAEQPSQFIGDIAGTSVTYNGMLVAVIITMSAKRLIDHISFSQFTSSEYEIFGMYKSNKDTRDFKSSDWQEITNYHSDVTHKGSYEFNLERDTFQSLMVVFGQPVFKNKRVDINPDRIARLIHNLEDEKFKKLFNIKELYNNALFNAGLEVHRKDDIKYKQPSVFAKVGKAMLKFLQYYMSILKPEAFITHKSGYLYDVGLYKLRIKYKEFRSFSVFESDLYKRNGNISSCQLAKSDYTSEDVFIKYFVKFESLTKRILGITEKRTNDMFVISDSSDLIADLDFLAKPPSEEHPINVYVNGQLMYVPDYQVVYADVSEQVVQAIQFAENIYSFGDVVKISYSISHVDANYNEYHPYMVDITKELGIPNLRDNILTDAANPETVVIRNEISGQTNYIPAEIGSTMRRGYLPTIAGEDPLLGWYVEKEFAAANLNSDIFDDSQDVNLGSPPGVRYHVLSGEMVEEPVDVIYRGIINEPVAYENVTGDGGLKNVIHAANVYAPGTTVVRVNGTPYFADEYEEGDSGTDLKKLTLRTKNIVATDEVTISYLPVDDDVMSDAATSNIAEHNRYEVRAGTDADSAITLDSYPFIDYSIIGDAGPNGHWIGIENRYSYKRYISMIYSPLEITIGGIPARDVTPYNTAEKPELSPYIDKNYEYYVQGNRLYFNVYIDPVAGRDIVIKYYTLGSRIRLRAELFRNNLTNQSVTPEMYDYTLLLNVT